MESINGRDGIGSKKTKSLLDRDRLRWIQVFDDALREFPDFIARRGKSWKGVISNWTYSPESSDMECLCSTNRFSKYVVSFSMDLDGDPDAEDFLYSVDCDCNYSLSHFFCEHSYAALKQLQVEFSNLNSNITRQIFAGPEATWTMVTSVAPEDGR